MAGIITSQNTRWPLSSATATQHYHNALHKQVDRSCVPQRRNKEGEVVGRREEEISRERGWGKEGMGHHKLRKLWKKKNDCLSPGPKSQLFSCGNTWHLCFYDPDNVCLDTERLHKVKGRATMVDVRSVTATSELSLITREAWHFCLYVMAMSPPTYPTWRILYKHDPFVGSQEDKPSLILLLAHQHLPYALNLCGSTGGQDYLKQLCEHAQSLNSVFS